MNNVGGSIFDREGIQNSSFEHYLMGFRNNLKDVRGEWVSKWIEKKPSQMVFGKYSVFTLKYGLAGGVGAKQNNSPYNRSRTQDVQRQEVLIKMLTAKGTIGIQTTLAGVTPQGAPEDLYFDAFSQVYDAAEDMENNEIFTDEAGALTSIKTAVVDIDFTTPGGFLIDVESTDRHQIGQVLDIYTVDTLIGANLIVKEDLFTTRQLRLEAQNASESRNGGSIDNTSVTVAIGDTLHYEESYGNGLTGIEEVFKTDNTYHGIPRATNSWYKTQNIDGGNAALNDNLLRRATDDVNKQSSGYKISSYVAEHGVIAVYEDTLQTFKRFNNMGTDAPSVQGGMTNAYLQYDNKNIYQERRCTPNTLYGISESTEDTGWQVVEHMDWNNDAMMDGLTLKFTETQAFDFRLLKYCNITTDSPRKNFVIQNLLNTITP